MEFDAGKRRSKRSRDDRHRHLSSRKRHDCDRYVDDERKSRDRDGEPPDKNERGKESERDSDRDRKRAMARRRSVSPGRLERRRCDDQEHGGDLYVRSPLAVTTQPETPCSECLVLKNVFDGAVEENPKFYLRIRNAIHRRCAQFGPVHHMHVDKNLGFVFLRFDFEQTSTDAQKGFHQSSFEGRVITATFMSSRLYSRKLQATGQS